MSRRCLRLWIVLSVFLPIGARAQSAAVSLSQSEAAVPAVLVSDIHFDPLHDPSKAKQLVAAPLSRWAAILALPDAADQPQSFLALQKRCGARGVDTPYALLRSSLGAMHDKAPHARFFTISGDLVVHSLPCRYGALLPGRSQAAYESFVEKTIHFVTEQIRAAFPGVPVYIALGNNDTECGDYRLDPNSAFLTATAPVIAAGVPAPERHSVEEQFRAGGYYSVALGPLRKTRLIVLNDVFLSPQYASCSGRPNTAPAQVELDWLSRQMDKAQQAGEQVWVMAHIPPGVNAFETVRRFRNVCSGEAPEMFLAPDDSARLEKILEEHARTVRLALFGHTHMDEMRLIRRMDGTGSFTMFTLTGNFPAKVVPSISPVDGNHPSFTVANVEPGGTVKNYALIVASNQTGVGTSWLPEYDYADTYREPDFSADSLIDLFQSFESDPKAQRPATQQYIGHYYKGNMAAALTPFWPQYECSLENLNPEDYTRCVCAQGKGAGPTSR